MAQSTLGHTDARTAQATVPILALLVLTYSLGEYARPRALLLAAPLPILLVTVVDLTDPAAGSLARALPFFTLVVVVVPVLAGRLVGSRRRLVAALRDHDAEAGALHSARLRAARAEQAMLLSEQLQGTLERGLDEISTQVAAARTGATADPAGIERRARELLAQTRDTVVRLSRPEQAVPATPGPPEPARAGPTPAASGTAQTWTLLASAGLGVCLLVETHTAWPDGPLRVLAAALGAAVALPLAWSWRRPVPSVVAVWVLACCYHLLIASLRGTTTSGLLVLVTCFVLGALATPRSGAFTAGVVGIGVALGASDVVGGVTLAAAGYLAGRALADHNRLLEQARVGVALREEERAVGLRQAVVDARTALAREVHDAIGHGLTVVALQAEAARRLQHSDPGRSAEALAVIERVARQSLADVRTGFDSTWDLETLIDEARAAGVDVRTSGSPTLAESRGPVAHRVLQEALTNAMRHAPGARVQITFADCPEGLLLRVDNDAGNVGRRLPERRRRPAGHAGSCGGPRRHPGLATHPRGRVLRGGPPAP